MDGKRCRVASDDYNLVKVMVSARVESDAAQSVFDGRARLQAAALGCENSVVTEKQPR